MDCGSVMCWLHRFHEPELLVTQSDMAKEMEIVCEMSLPLVKCLTHVGEHRMHALYGDSHTHTHAHTHTRIHIHTHTHTHTHMHTHTRTHT